MGKPDTPHFLITLDCGIGDAVAVGLNAVDQIIRNDPTANGAIDVLCNQLQTEVFTYDPTILLLHAKRFGLRIPEATFEWNEVLARVHQVILTCVLARWSKHMPILSSDEWVLDEDEIWIVGAVLAAVLVSTKKGFHRN